MVCITAARLLRPCRMMVSIETKNTLIAIPCTTIGSISTMKLESGV